MRLHGEAGGADQEGVRKAQSELPGILERYTPDYIFYVDETGLFYRSRQAAIISDTLCGHFS